MQQPHYPAPSPSLSARRVSSTAFNDYPILMVGAVVVSVSGRHSGDFVGAPVRTTVGANRESAKLIPKTSIVFDKRPDCVTVGAVVDFARNTGPGKRVIGAVRLTVGTVVDSFRSVLNTRTNLRISAGSGSIGGSTISSHRY